MVRINYVSSNSSIEAESLPELQELIARQFSSSQKAAIRKVLADADEKYRGRKNGRHHRRAVLVALAEKYGVSPQTLQQAIR